jgi:hypothetical protein
MMLIIIGLLLQIGHPRHAMHKEVAPQKHVEWKNNVVPTRITIHPKLLITPLHCQQ